MGLKPALIYILSLILIINLPALLFINSFRVNAFDIVWYESEFSKVGSYEFGYDKDTVDSTAAFLIGYLQHDKTKNPPAVAIFVTDENVHLLEVKQLVQKALLLADISVIAFIFLNLALFFLVRLDFGAFINYITKQLVYGSIMAISIAAIIVLSLWLNFSSSFANFHLLLFTGQWQFPPESAMIQMFPAEFFYDIGQMIFINALTAAVLLLVIAQILNTKQVFR